MDYIPTDTETGGFYPSINALLSIGACCSWSGEAFEIYITVESQPGKTVDAQAAAKNGYTRERWAELGAVDLQTAMERFKVWLEARKKERRHAKFICHHLAFDKGFLQEAERITKIEMPHRHDWRCSQLKFGELMDENVIERGSSSLDRLKELSGWNLPRAEAHNALQDARITLHGYLWLLERDKDAERALSELAGMRLKRIEFFETGRSVLQPWLIALPRMQQTVLLTAIRGPDGQPKYGAVKMLLRWFRRCVLLSALDGEVLADPVHEGGGSFTGPSVRLALDEPWEAAMRHVVDEYLRTLDALPHHFQLHFMHAAEILGYKHPDSRIGGWWLETYCRLVRDMHLYPETVEQLDERLGDSRSGWLKHADAATTD